MSIRNRITDYPAPLVPVPTGPTGPIGPAGADGKSAYQSYLDTTDDDPVLSEAEWAERNSSAGAAVITSTTPPDDTTAIWLDPEGWIYSVWNGVDAWVSLQNNPTTSTYFYWNTALFTWQDGESDPTYTFTWEP